MAFDLTASPFALLNVSPRTSKADLAEAYQSAILDGSVDEPLLDRALSALTSAKNRIHCEIGFLPAATPEETRRILQLARARSQLDGEGKSPLDQANLAAHDLSHGGELSRIDDMAVALASIDPDEVHRTINSARQVAQFNPSSRLEADAALSSIIAEHAATAAAIVVAKPERAGIAQHVVVDGLDRPGSREFLTHFIAAYTKLTSQELHSLQAAIEAKEAALRSRPDIQRATELVTLLGEWDALRQPVQLWDQAQGIDEPLSKDMGEGLRDLCLWLANERDEYDIALSISRGLKEAFAELFDLHGQFEADVTALEKLSDQSRIEKIIAPLLAILAEIKAAPVQASLNIANRLDRDSSLREAFEVALRAGSGAAELAGIEVRSLAIYLNNDHGQRPAAHRLTDWLLEYRARLPADLIQKVLDDRVTLYRLTQQAELKKAMEARRYGDASRLLTSLLSSTTDPDDRTTLQHLVRTVADLKRRQTKSRFYWGILALIVLFWVFSHGNSPTGSDLTTTDIDSQMQSDTASIESATGGPFDNAPAIDTTTMDEAATDVETETPTAVPPAEPAIGTDGDGDVPEEIER